ncbi:hypothetical protein G6O67_001678 [Ophiocordyceps sinensis]|uniref:RRM domain-containing protein n=1 Tax=Ophiocordyceps sinensis TaxID=72228 RepID=A0A8H4PY49_9HYPO|nr:hypothetical protein G6O67_001678 [Ophiocordyceps sinensis]
MSGRGGKLAPEVNRALFIKNLSYNVTPEELFDIFGKFGPIRQVRQGISNTTKGTAFVVYEDVIDAKQACDKLNGFNFQNRYLVVLYHQPEKMINLQDKSSSLAGRSPTITKPTSPDPKTILRKGTPAANKMVAKGNAATRAVRFVDVVQGAPQLRA